MKKFKKWKNIELLLGHKKGLGAAYIRGMQHAMEKMHADAVIEFDADFQHDPHDIPRLVEAMDQGYDYVIGSRYIKGGSIPKEFGLLAAVGYSRWGLILRVAWESLGVTIAAWILGVGPGVAVLSWFNLSFMVPHGLLMNIFDWNVLALHTLPIPLMVFLFGMGTVAWQLLRLDPISIIERRD